MTSLGSATTQMTAAVPLVAGADGTQPVSLRQVLADGTAARWCAWRSRMASAKAWASSSGRERTKKASRWAVLRPMPGRRGKLLHQGLPGRGKIFHRDRVPLSLADCRCSLTPQDANGFRRVLGAVDGAAGHQHVGAGFHDQRGGLGVHAAVHLQVGSRDSVRSIYWRICLELGQLVGHKLLAAKARLHRHHQDEVHVAPDRAAPPRRR